MTQTKTRQAAPAAREVVDMQAIAAYRAADLAFFLDIDGTLLEFADTPDAVQVAPILPGLLAALRDTTGGAVALISGRRLDDVERLFPDLGLPAAGQHGAEFRGLIVGAPEPSYPEAAWQKLRDDAQQARAAHPRLLFENKGRSIAIHYRKAPALAPIARWLALRLAGQSRGQFVVQRGHYVEEIKSAAASKGGAIERLLGEPAFQGRRPVFIGDDVTDEDGFRRVNLLSGISIKVGPGPTVAHWHLRDPAAVLAWLGKVVEFLKAPSGA